MSKLVLPETVALEVVELLEDFVVVEDVKVVVDRVEEVLELLEDEPLDTDEDFEEDVVLAVVVGYKMHVRWGLLRVLDLRLTFIEVEVAVYTPKQEQALA
jgi:hypothetical protein